MNSLLHHSPNLGQLPGMQMAKNPSCGVGSMGVACKKAFISEAKGGVEDEEDDGAPDENRELRKEARI